MSSAPTAFADRTCAACPIGTFKAAAGNEACVAWAKCAAGQGKVVEGTASADRQCAPCDTGVTFSASNDGAACAATSAPCAAGKYVSLMATASSDRTCSTCAAGEFKSAAANTACTLWRTCAIGEGMSAPGTKVADRQDRKSVV